MKKIRIFSLILAICLVFPACPGAKATQSDTPVTNGCHSVDAAMMLSDADKLTETAKAIVVYELNSGTMLYNWNPDEKIYPTSMVKIMTTLVALENGNPDEEVTVTRSVLNQVPIGILGADLKAGDKITLKNLLFSTMVESATDASVIAAAHVGGSIEGFLQMMNEKAAELGCQNTHYGNVHGLHDADTYTTARDIARITEAALKNETFREMFETARYTIGYTKSSGQWVEREIVTTNNMMNERNSKYYDKRVTGGKTGATDQGGRCLTLTAEQNGMDLLCVLMGAVPTYEENGSISAHGSFEESKVILDYAFANYEFRQVFFDGQSLEQYPVENGASHVVSQAASSASTVMPIEVDNTLLKWIYQPENTSMTAPIKQGQQLGTAEVWYGNKCLAKTQMVAMHAVQVYQAPVVPDKPPAKQSTSWVTILLLVLALAVVVFAAFVGIRILKIRHYQRSQKRRSRRQ